VEKKWREGEVTPDLATILLLNHSICLFRLYHRTKRLHHRPIYARSMIPQKLHQKLALTLHDSLREPLL
jgi:hypothetical protein